MDVCPFGTAERTLVSLINYFTKYHSYDIFSSYAQKKNKHFTKLYLEFGLYPDSNQSQTTGCAKNFRLSSNFVLSFFSRKCRVEGRWWQIVVKNAHLSLCSGMCPPEFPACIVCGHQGQVKVCFPQFLQLSQQGRYACEKY